MEIEIRKGHNDGILTENELYNSAMDERCETIRIHILCSRQDISLMV